jgi:hypothetical protein
VKSMLPSGDVWADRSEFMFLSGQVIGQKQTPAFCGAGWDCPAVEGSTNPGRRPKPLARVQGRAKI